MVELGLRIARWRQRALKTSRITAELASRRNEFVAALSDEVFIAHASVGGHLESLTRRLRAWGIPYGFL
jgi:hypothetical protein